MASNTYSASLVTQFLLDGAVTKLQNRWAALKVFSKDYSQDRYKPRATGQLKFVTTGGTTQKNATNFESGDATVTNVQIAVDQYTTAFHVTNDELNSGLRMENLVDIKVAECADNVLKVAFSPLATASFTTNTATLSGIEPSLTYLNSPTVSGGTDAKSIYVQTASSDGTVILGAKSKSGSCFYMQDSANAPTQFAKDTNGACADLATTLTWGSDWTSVASS